MKVIIAGSRTIKTRFTVLQAMLDSQFQIDEVVSGTTQGVDKIGENLAAESNIPIKRFPANWSKYGKSAGPIRNKQMAEYADALIAVWDGKSKGTKSMIDIATKLELKVFIKQENIV